MGVTNNFFESVRTSDHKGRVAVFFPNVGITVLFLYEELRHLKVIVENCSDEWRVPLQVLVVKVLGVDTLSDMLENFEILGFNADVEKVVACGEIVFVEQSLFFGNEFLYFGNVSFVDRNFQVFHVRAKYF